MKAKRKLAAVAVPLRLDIGCGKNKREGFIGVDQYAMPGVDAVCDLGRQGKWRLRWNPPHQLVGVVGDYVSPEGREGWFELRDDSVEEVHCSHFIEHLTNLNDKWERVKFFNELYRVMKPGAKAQLILPHWCSERYYGDPTHKEPFSEMGFYYLSRKWRLEQTPHTDISVNPNGYDCDFQATWGYSLHPDVSVRSQSYHEYAMKFYKGACQDIMATLVKV